MDEEEGVREARDRENLEAHLDCLALEKFRVHHREPLRDDDDAVVGGDGGVDLGDLGDALEKQIEIMRYTSEQEPAREHAP